MCTSEVKQNYFLFLCLVSDGEQQCSTTEEYSTESPSTAMPSFTRFPTVDSGSTSGDYDRVDYNEYYDDLEEYNSDNYDESEEEEYPDISKISVEARAEHEIDLLISTLPPAELRYLGHLFENLVRNCTWKGLDCKTG